MLHEKSKVPEPENREERLRALIGEHQFLRGVMTALETDPQRFIPSPRTAALCAVAASIPDIHSEEVLAAWGEEDVLRGACEIMMSAVQAVVDDPTARFNREAFGPVLANALDHQDPITPDPAAPGPLW